MKIQKGLAVAAGTLVLVAVATTGAPRAQHSYTPQQIAQGKALYDANCGRCHNDDGAGVTGVELFKQFRRASSDDDIARLVQNGIPGTSMPPHAFTTEQAHSVVAYMRSMVGVAPAAAGPAGPAASEPLLAGEPARGKALFTSAGCVNCHRAEGAGGTSGPDLSSIAGGRGRGGFGGQRDPAALARAILDPNAEIASGHQRFEVTPLTGGPVRGTLLNQDTFSVQLRDEGQNLRGFVKSDLKAFGFLPSAMPSYRGRLSPQEVGDIVSYLLTLRGPAQ